MGEDKSYIHAVSAGYTIHCICGKEIYGEDAQLGTDEFNDRIMCSCGRKYIVIATFDLEEEVQ